MTPLRALLGVAFFAAATISPAQQEEYDPLETYSSKFSESSTELVSGYSESLNTYLDDKLGDIGVGGMCGIDFSLSIPVNIPDVSCEKIMPELGYEADFSYDIPKPDAMKSVEEFSKPPEGFE